MTKQPDPKRPPKKVGAPKGSGSKYTPELGQAICERLSKGEPLAQICRDKGMPVVDTVLRWTKEHADFAQLYARARAAGFDAIALEAMQIADEELSDVMNPQAVARARLRVDTRRWLLSKWDPKRYGDRLALDAEVNVKTSPAEMSDEDLAKIAAGKAHE